MNHMSIAHGRAAAPLRAQRRMAAAGAASAVASSASLARPQRPSRQPSMRAYAYIEEDKNWHQLAVKHVIESQQFGREALDIIFNEAAKMERVRPGTPEAKMLDGYIMATLFYEPSTRTRLSFESAMARLGGMVLSTESAGEYSSAAKGETLEGE